MLYNHEVLNHFSYFTLKVVITNYTESLSRKIPENDKIRHSFCEGFRHGIDDTKCILRKRCIFTLTSL